MALAKGGNMSVSLKRYLPLLLVAVLLASGCRGAQEDATGDGAADQGPVKVGVLIQLSGAAGVFGPPSREAAELAIDEINEAGGVLGRDVELVVADDATDVKVAGEQAQKLVNQDEVDVLISTESSAAREAVLPIAKRAGTLMIYTPLYEGGACDELLFNLGEVPEQQVAPVIPYLQDEYGGDKWFIVGDDYVWPRSLGEVTNEIVGASDGSVVGEQYVPLGTSEFGTIINKIKSSQADFVLMTLVGSDAIAFVKQLNDFGLGKQVKIFGLAMLDNILPALGKDVEPILAAFGYFETLDVPTNAEFLQALDDRVGEKRSQQTTLSEGTYEAIHLWAQAANEAGTVEGQEVATAMGGQTFDAPRGPITVDEETHHVAQHIYLGESQPDGTYEVIKDFGEIEPGDQCSL